MGQEGRKEKKKGPKSYKRKNEYYLRWSVSDIYCVLFVALWVQSERKRRNVKRAKPFFFLFEKELQPQIRILLMPS